MVPRPDGRGERTLLILNHRGEALDEVRGWLEGRGWRVVAAGDLEASLQVLERPADAVLVAPLTLRPDTLEWERLARRLRAPGGLACLILPWSGAPPGAMGRLLETLGPLADWLPCPVEPAAVEASLEHRLRTATALAEARSRATALEGQLVADHKTDLFNERHFRSRLQEEFERTRRHGTPVTLLLLDLDDFKQINDRTSYEFGDVVLREVGRLLRGAIRAIDIAARLGGDEFAVLLPNTTLAEGVAVARRLRDSAARRPVEALGHMAELRLSAGLATFEGHGLAAARELFLQANEALKEAKQGGKNRISIFDPRQKPGLRSAVAGPEGTPSP